MSGSDRVFPLEEAKKYILRLEPSAKDGTILHYLMLTSARWGWKQADANPVKSVPLKEHLAIRKAFRETETAMDGRIAKLEIELTAERARVKRLREALDQVQCPCTIRERESGHVTGCFMPHVIEALAETEVAGEGT